MIPRLFALVGSTLGLLFVWNGATDGADLVKDASLHVTFADATRPPASVEIAIRLVTLDRKLAPAIDAAKSQNAGLFELAAIGGKNERVALTVVPPRADTPTTAAITLHPTKPLDPSKAYHLRILPGGVAFNTLELQKRGIHIVPFENQWLPVGGKDEKSQKQRLKADTDFVNPFPQTSASLIQGGTGAFSLAANYRKFLGEDRHAALHTSLDADLSLRSPSKSNYINAIQSEIGGYWVVEPQNGILELGVSSKTQADQQFRKIEQTVGVNGWLWLNCKLFDEIYRLPMSLTQPGQKDLFAALPPTLVFGYDYVGHLRDETNGPEDGSNRLSGRFYLVIPLYRNVNSTFPILSHVKGINFLTDISAIYDINKGKFAPETKLALDFPLSNSEQQPSITVSFVNGQSAPRFENFNAILAGFKIKL